MTCDRLGPRGGGGARPLQRRGRQARGDRSPIRRELVRSAQTELVRLGCLTGTVDGTLSAPTKSALSRYLSIGGQPTDNASVTQALVAELTKHTTRVCPIECKTGETLKGGTCVADQKPAAAPAVASRKNDDEDNAKAGRKQASRRAGAYRSPAAEAAPAGPPAGGGAAEHRAVAVVAAAAAAATP